MIVLCTYYDKKHTKLRHKVKPLKIGETTSFDVLVSHQLENFSKSLVNLYMTRGDIPNLMI